MQGILLANSSLVVEHHPEEAVRLCRATPHCAGLSQDPSTGLTYSLEWIHFPLLSRSAVLPIDTWIPQFVIFISPIHGHHLPY